MENENHSGKLFLSLVDTHLQSPSQNSSIIFYTIPLVFLYLLNCLFIKEFDLVFLLNLQNFIHI